MNAQTQHEAKSEHDLSIQIQGQLGMIALDRVKHLNALSLEMVQGIYQQLETWLEQDQVQAVLIHSNSPKAFCAGGDIRYLYDSFQTDENDYRDYFAAEYALLEYIRQYKKPIIVMLDGYVLGGGFGLAQACHIQVSSEKSRFAMPETIIGFFPDVGATHFLSRLDEVGVYMALTGEQISSSDALYLDLLDYHVPSEQFTTLQTALSSAQTLNERRIREIIGGFITDPAPSQLQTMAERLNKHFGFATLDEIEKSLADEKYPNDIEWAQKTLHAIQQRPKMAMQTSLKLQQIGQSLSLEKCMKLERDVQDIWLEQGDFIEGVRALLIDKDKNPQWKTDNTAFEKKLATVFAVGQKHLVEHVE